MRPRLGKGFTLVELLVVIGIIAVLISILLPALSRARAKANEIKCAANLRAVGQGVQIYVAENDGVFPASYVYEGTKVEDGVQTPDAAVDGYIHWSYFIYGAGSMPKEAFTCPSIDNGGLPPTNTTDDNLDSGQSNDNGSVVDKQARRMAYTANEAIMPRNKFTIGFQGTLRVSQHVKLAQVTRPSNTVLATEFNRNWRVVADAGRSDPASTVCKSHRPVHGFRGMTGELNFEKVPPDAFGRRPAYRRVDINDLQKSVEIGAASSSRLDWVGRHHGKVSVGADGWDTGTTNFLYVDGHVENKHIRDTVEKRFEWGEVFYGVRPNLDMVKP